MAIDEYFVFRLVRRAWRGKNREKNGRVKSWGREARPFLLAVFFRVTLDGLSERGTTRSLRTTEQKRSVLYEKDNKLIKLVIK